MSFRLSPVVVRSPVLARLLLSLLVWANAAAAGRDFYKILGVPRKANEQHIKKAYRKLSMKWHPDKNPDRPKFATKRFQEISEAYEVEVVSNGKREVVLTYSSPSPASKSSRTVRYSRRRPRI